MALKATIASLACLNRGARAGLWWTSAGFLPLFALVSCMLLLAGAGLSLLNMGFTLPRHELMVGIKKKDVSIFRVLEQGSAPAFSDQDLEAMRGQPGVTDIYPISYGVLPATARVAFFGQNFDTEMVLQAIDPAWLRPELAKEASAWQEGQLVPIVLNNSILAIYNHAYSKSQGLPELSENALKTPIITLTYGQPGREIELKGRVVGLSPKVALGAAIPNETLRWLHQQLKIEQPPMVEVVMRLEAGKDVRRAREAVEALGFVINEPGQLLQVIARARELAFQAFWPVFLLLCLLSALFLGQGYATVMVLRREAYRDRLAEGASRPRLITALLCEGGLIVAVHLLLGSLLGLMLADFIAANYILPFLSMILSDQIELDVSLLNLFLLNGAMWSVCLLLLWPRAVSATRPLPR